MHNLGIDFETAQQMPMHYALAFLSEKAGLMQGIQSKFEHERQNNTHAPSSSSVDKSYRSTRRACS